MAAGPVQLVIFPEVMPGNTGRADAEIVFAPFSVLARPGSENETMMDHEPGCNFMGFPLRGSSEGTVMARSSNPADPPLIDPNYLDTEYDRAVTVGLFRFIRNLMTQPALAPFVVAELGDAASVQTDDEIIDMIRDTGVSGYHSAGTCKMGVDGDNLAVLDERLRVRGAQGLRVVDLSAMPLQVSANTNGPVMAMAYKLADMMKQDLAQAS